MTELIANVPTPGQSNPIVYLAANTAPDGTTITTNGGAPAALQGGEFRIVIDHEILIVTAGQTGTSWNVTRGAEGSTAAAHTAGASVYHYLTAGGLTATIQDIAATYVDALAVQVKSYHYPMVQTDHAVLADSTLMPITITLPSAIGMTHVCYVAATASNTNLVTLQTTLSQMIAIAGQPSSGTQISLGSPASGASLAAATLISDQTNWWVV